VPATSKAAAGAGELPGPAGDYGFVVAASRLPVDRVEEPDGTSEWRRSPGGLVTEHVGPVPRPERQAAIRDIGGLRRAFRPPRAGPAATR